MAKLTRQFQKIFAGLATNNGQFGSAQTGAKNETTDIEELQDLAAYENGWLDAVISGQKLPPLEEFQALHYIDTYQLAYLFQEGIPEWNTDTDYFQYSIVKAPGTFQLYGSLINDNQGNALPSGVSNANWQYLGDLAGTVTFTGTAPTDNGVARYDGITGKIIQKSFTEIDDNGNILAKGNAGTGTAIRLYEGINYFGIKASNALTTDLEFTAPTADGTANQVLATNGSNVLSFIDVLRATSTTLANAGSITLSNGLILKWGRRGSSWGGGVEETWTFPAAFPTGCFIALANPVKASGAGAWSIKAAPSASAVIFTNGGTAADDVYYFAIGY